MLQGVKVIEFASVVAAPSAGGLLADWGADVVKIEPHAGDSMRGRPGSPLGSTNFDIHNRNKRGIALNTNAPDTQEVLLRLVAGADIFLTNMLPSRLEKIGMDWNSLHAVNPAMVYGAVSSFGWNGPDRDRGAADNLGFWARGGGTGLLTVEGADPVPIRQSVGDRITGLAACGGILAALFDAQRSGVGRFVETSLLSAAMWSFATDVTNQANKGRVAPSQNRQGAVFPLANYFKTKDAQWIQLHTDLPTLAKAFDRADLADNPNYASPRLNSEQRASLVSAIDNIFAGFDFAEISKRLDDVGARFEPVQSTADLLRDPQVIANKRMVRVGAEESQQWQVANPCSVVGDEGETDVRVKPSPGLGEHTTEILTEIGFFPQEIDRMRANGTILGISDWNG